MWYPKSEQLVRHTLVCRSFAVTNCEAKVSGAEFITARIEWSPTNDKLKSHLQNSVVEESLKNKSSKTLGVFDICLVGLPEIPSFASGSKVCRTFGVSQL